MKPLFSSDASPMSPRRFPTWAWRTAWTTIRVSLSCRVAARRSASPSRLPTLTSSRSGCGTFRCSWTTRASSCMVRGRTRSSAVFMGTRSGCSLSLRVDCSAAVSHRVPEGEDWSGEQRLPDQKPFILREPTHHVHASVLSSRTRWQRDREGAEPDESVHFQRWSVLFRAQGEFL